MARKGETKFDYDGQEFYQEIFALAFQGFNDAEIADGLGDKFGKTLNPSIFNKMKNGNYDGWTEEENKRRSEIICQAITRARRKTNAIVRGRYLKMALGGIKTKNTTKRFLQYQCDCNGDINCPKCGGTGYITSTTKAVVQETECETAPSLQALSTWLYNHDAEWREMVQGKKNEDVPQDIEHGVDISAWIEDKVTEKYD